MWVVVDCLVVRRGTIYFHSIHHDVLPHLATAIFEPLLGWMR